LHETKRSMRYTERYGQLKNLCESNPLSDEIRIPESSVSIRFIAFNSIPGSCAESKVLSEIRQTIPGLIDDENNVENNKFRYPVFIPGENRKAGKAIIMMHGLNERRYDKYLSWAHYLAEGTGKPVIVFPISFHINRSNPGWLDPRLISEKMQIRKEKYLREIPAASFINHTISERLTDSPQRFFLNGFQTSIEIHRLMQEMYQGKHPLFEKGTKADLFAYSIGGLLGQVMFMANPDNLLSDSKLFLFCAGSVFGDMNGVSKVILDETAHHCLQDYYQVKLEKEIKKKGVMQEFFKEDALGMAFRSMLTPMRFRNYRKKIFRKSAARIYALPLRKDLVIPPSGIFDSLSTGRGSRKVIVDVHDFSYPYSHEVPFPVKYHEIKDFVDDAFEEVFRKAVVFLS